MVFDVTIMIMMLARAMDVVHHPYSNASVKNVSIIHYGVIIMLVPVLRVPILSVRLILVTIMISLHGLCVLNVLQFQVGILPFLQDFIVNFDLHYIGMAETEKEIGSGSVVHVLPGRSTHLHMTYPKEDLVDFGESLVHAACTSSFIQYIFSIPFLYQLVGIGVEKL